QWVSNEGKVGKTDESDLLTRKKATYEMEGEARKKDDEGNFIVTNSITQEEKEADRVARAAKLQELLENNPTQAQAGNAGLPDFGPRPEDFRPGKLARTLLPQSVQDRLIASNGAKYAEARYEKNFLSTYEQKGKLFAVSKADAANEEIMRSKVVQNVL